MNTNNKFVTPGKPTTQPPPETLQQIADRLAQKTTGTEVFQPSSPKLPSNVLPK